MRAPTKRIPCFRSCLGSPSTHPRLGFSLQELTLWVPLPLNFHGMGSLNTCRCFLSQLARGLTLPLSDCVAYKDVMIPFIMSKVSADRTAALKLTRTLQCCCEDVPSALRGLLSDQVRRCPSVSSYSNVWRCHRGLTYLSSERWNGSRLDTSPNESRPRNSFNWRCR